MKDIPTVTLKNGVTTGYSRSPMLKDSLENKAQY